MTSAPADLLAFRSQLLAVTGLTGNALGIAPDPRHLASGGYHVGQADIAANGRYHPPASANVGSSSEDYSVRQLRDRQAGGNTSSAVDIGSTWKPGRAAWLRFNNALYQEMLRNPANLPALRAINVSLDGTAKRRYDQLHRGDGLIASTDTVDTHTHLEFWRDTEGRRAATLTRIVQLAQAATNGNTPAAATGDDDMTQLTEDKIDAFWNDRPTTQLTGGGATVYAVPIVQRIRAMDAKLDSAAAAAVADEQRDRAALAAITGIADAIKATGGNINAAPIIAAVYAVGDKVHAEMTGLQQLLAESRERELALQYELAEVKAAAEVGLSPAELNKLHTP